MATNDRELAETFIAGSGAHAAVEQESSVLRYYTSQLMLRVLASDDYDPLGASFAEFGSTESAQFLSIWDTISLPSLLRTPSVVVLPPTGQSSATSDLRLTRGIFTVIPSEGFVKEPGQPVYYNDPIELMDQRGRLLGIVTRSPHAGHLAADGHSGGLVFVMERHKSRVQNVGNKFIRQEMRGMSTAKGAVCGEGAECRDGMRRKFGLVRRSSLVEVCGGERLRIPGLVRVATKQFPGGAIMQYDPESPTGERKSFLGVDRKSFLGGDKTTLMDRESFIEDETPFLTCEIVLTSPSPGAGSDSTSSTGNQRPPKSATKKGTPQIADRTATGDFVGVLHSGVLHRRSEHMKIWKKRFFVLTQVALHRFEVTETLQTIKTQKPRGSIYLRDCRGVRYERFSRPHELEIELSNGKLFSLHAVDALTCANWASMLSRAIENPHWVHAERDYLTVWRSDQQFESPRCPKVTKVMLRRGTSMNKPSSGKGGRPISENPHWGEKLSLGGITANGFVIVQLANGNVFRLTLEDLTRSLIHPCWVSVSTSLEVAKIQSLDEESDGVPDELEDFPRKSEAVTDEKSRFLVRLKFQADLQLDQRLTKRVSPESERTVVLGTFSVLMLIPAIAYGYRHSIDDLARSCCVFSASLLGAMIIAAAPVVWHVYLWMRYGPAMEGELHWFLTLLAIEVRPHGDEISDRFSTSSGEDSRSRIDSILSKDDDDESEDGAVIVPTKTPMYGYDGWKNGGPRSLLTPEAIRIFRLENALDSILGRPQLSFFAIKRIFPTKFLPRDELGRRVLLVSLNSIDRKGMAAHNISGFNIVRYFLYLWEFIWSYQDLREGVSHSELVFIIDCSGWHYFKWLSIECQLVLLVLENTHRFYLGRLAKVIFVRDKSSFGLYGRLMGSCLDPAIRGIVERHHSLGPFLQDAKDSEQSKDEKMLHDFVTNILATHANVTIPCFTRRELEQAARIAVTGSLDEDAETMLKADTIGTRAVVIPNGVGSPEWETVLEDGDLTMWKARTPTASHPGTGKSYQSDAEISQWRGRLELKATNADMVMKYLRDPALAGTWMEQNDQLMILDKLSRQEDICFWSRRVPFMNFSLSGHRGASSQLQTNAIFHCVMRRMHEMKKGRRHHDRIGTVMWKTTSAQRSVVDFMDESNAHPRDLFQWRKLEDPFVSLCFSIEETSSAPGKHKLTLSFWFQSFSPPTTAKQNVEIARLIAKKVRNLDARSVESEANVTSQK